ncbi:MAG: LamB/YcsF family protein [Candidatus Bathyarchaeota archaeon]|nr:MAG: LamB/YcsF family protein [Candidatus Bathyarchaeota archaeon]
MNQKIDLNCDLGESFGPFKIGHDAKIMPFITSANIACGFHSGDPSVMARTVKLAKENGVAVGAHPGFSDLPGFGRRFINMSQNELKDAIIYQIGALEAFAKAGKIDLQHIKPHGALYNAAVKDETYAEAVIEAIQEVNPELILFALPHSEMKKMGTRAGLRVAHEAFIDRAYNPDGSLVSRSKKGAVISDTISAVERAMKIVKEKRVKAIDGQIVSFGEVHTLCVHGDTVNSVELAASVKKALGKSGCKVMSVGFFV